MNIIYEAVSEIYLSFIGIIAIRLFRIYDYLPHITALMMDA